jgi:hypothetical protein
MEESHSWEATSHSGSQEIPYTLWNPKFHYRVHKSPPLIPVVSQIHSAYSPISPRPTLILYSHLCLGVPSGLVTSFFFQSKCCVLVHLSHACYMPSLFHLPRFDHLNNIWWAYNLWSSSLCSLLQPPTTAFLKNKMTNSKIYLFIEMKQVYTWLGHFSLFKEPENLLPCHKSPPLDYVLLLTQCCQPTYVSAPQELCSTSH